jgi:hypothetical protein
LTVCDHVKCAWNVSSMLVFVVSVVVSLDVLWLLVELLLEDELLELEDVEESDVVVVVQVTMSVEVAEVVIVTVAVPGALTRAKLYT